MKTVLQSGHLCIYHPRQSKNSTNIFFPMQGLFFWLTEIASSVAQDTHSHCFTLVIWISKKEYLTVITQEERLLCIPGKVLCKIIAE